MANHGLAELFILLNTEESRKLRWPALSPATFHFGVLSVL